MLTSPFFTDGGNIFFDVRHLVAAHAADGTEEHDGLYALRIILTVGHECHEMSEVYNDKAKRDTILATLIAQVGAYHLSQQSTYTSQAHEARQLLDMAAQLKSELKRQHDEE